MAGLWDGPKAYESCIRINERDAKPRSRGVTEVRDKGMGLEAVRDLCDSSGEFIDILKIYCGVMRMQPSELTRRKIALAKEYDIPYSTGGVLERVILEGPKAVYSFMEESKELGFDEIEVSSGTLILPLEQKLDLIKLAHEFGLKAKPEVAMAYGITPGEKPTMSAEKLIYETLKCIEANADKVMIEEEGLTENVSEWREDIIYKIAASCPLNELMFEASDPAVYSWYIKNFGSDVNLFIDATQVNHLEVSRRGIWGKDNIWGRVGTFVRSG